MDENASIETEPITAPRQGPVWIETIPLESPRARNGSRPTIASPLSVSEARGTSGADQDHEVLDAPEEDANGAEAEPVSDVVERVAPIDENLGELPGRDAPSSNGAEQRNGNRSPDAQAEPNRFENTVGSVALAGRTCGLLGPIDAGARIVYLSQLQAPPGVDAVIVLIGGDDYNLVRRASGQIHFDVARHARKGAFRPEAIEDYASILLSQVRHAAGASVPAAVVIWTKGEVTLGYMNGARVYLIDGPEIEEGSPEPLARGNPAASVRRVAYKPGSYVVLVDSEAARFVREEGVRHVLEGRSNSPHMALHDMAEQLALLGARRGGRTSTVVVASDHGPATQRTSQTGLRSRLRLIGVGLGIWVIALVLAAITVFHLFS